MDLVAVSLSLHAFSGFYGAEANPSSIGNTALGNPRIPPFPLPTTVTPLVQIKQPSILGSMSAVASTMTGSPARAKIPQHQVVIGDQTCIATCFSNARTFQYGGSKAGKGILFSFSLQHWELWSTNNTFIQYVCILYYIKCYIIIYVRIKCVM